MWKGRKSFNQPAWVLCHWWSDCWHHFERWINMKYIIWTICIAHDDEVHQVLQKTLSSMNTHRMLIWWPGDHFCEVIEWHMRLNKHCSLFYFSLCPLLAIIFNFPWGFHGNEIYRSKALMWESHDQRRCIIMKNDKWRACGDHVCGALAQIAAFPVWHTQFLFFRTLRCISDTENMCQYTLRENICYKNELQPLIAWFICSSGLCCFSTSFMKGIMQIM